MMRSISRVLVTNAQQRKTLAAIRSLGRRGLRVTAGERFAPAMSFFSKYVDKVVIYPDPETQPDAFMDWLLSFLRTEPHDVLFPMDDDVMDVVTQHPSELQALVQVPVVDRRTYLLANDKNRTMLAAQEAGVSCPKTIVPSSRAEVARLAPNLSYPVVIKPRSSSGSRGLEYVFTQNALPDTWQTVHSQFPQPLVQQYIPPGGQALGVSALLDRDSQPLAVFVHRRLREYPVTGGPSALCESVEDADLARLGVSLLQHLKWFGVAMVEFKTHPETGVPYLMEINPRFWGSLQLGIYCGVDFPWMLYQLAVGEAVVPVDSYQTGKRYRWLPGDILHFIHNKDRWTIAWDFMHPDLDRTCYEVFSLEDWGPSVGLPLSLGRQAMPSMLKAISSRHVFSRH